MSLFVDVVFNLPLENQFTYSVGNENTKNVAFGKRAKVPFGKRTLNAFIIKIHKEKPAFECKEIIEVIDNKPVFSNNTTYFAKWIAEYYISSFGEALSLFVPKEIKNKKIKKITEEKKTTQPKKENTFLTLNNEQKNAFKHIQYSINKNVFDSFLLFGITGSGKTEVYKHLVKKIISKNKQALILVPEIALTPQTINHFKQSFEEKRIAILHSKLGNKEKSQYWNKIQNNEVDIILGARSAIFAPIKKLGIIIIDEEHEGSYKSQDTPRYHARQFAYKIAQNLNIPLVLGSATPSIETYSYFKNKKINLLNLIKRHSLYEKQLVHIVDMKKEKSKSFISKTLFEKIIDRITQKQQTIIFLNKRGYSPIIICKDCGYTLHCPNCDISLTYHNKTNKMRCHYCNYAVSKTVICPACKKNNVKLTGYGTEKVEEELKQKFPKASIQRMDFDTTRTKGAYEKILNNLENKKIDILVGTQMLAKGLHFPNVTLVGVLLADLSLHLPDFRATEKTFSLLTQITGRAGRGSLHGEALIQTYLPEHYVIQTAKKQDYLSFYLKEIKERQKFYYPPFSRIVKFLIRGKDENKVITHSKKIYQLLKNITPTNIEILGPSAAPIAKINNNFRWQILLKAKKQTNLHKLAKLAYSSFKKDNKTYIEVDIDPINLM